MPCSSTYCLSNTGYPTFDDLYFSAGTYNSELYWTGQTNNLFIYYNTGTTQWCLSTALNGLCLLSGQSPCFNPCPDLDGVYFSSVSSFQSFSLISKMAAFGSKEFV